MQIKARTTNLLSILLLSALTTSVSAQNAKGTYQGFNSGSTLPSREAKTQSDFESEFKTAQALSHSPGSFNSVRLYTNIQASTSSDPISAFPAAIATNTSILLGIWCSGTDNIDDELLALEKAVTEYGEEFTRLVVGLSVGSEDLYRVSESGVRNEAGLGQGPEEIAGFVKEVRRRLGDGGALDPLKDVPIGHVDSWSAWGNKSNRAVFEAVDFVGVDLYPYYEDDRSNSIENSKTIFDTLLRNVTKAAGNKKVWITETGWPVSGPDFGDAVASTENAKRFWDEVGCGLFGKMNVWWYNLRDSNPDTEAKFALSADLTPSTAFNLTCPASAGAPASINLEDKEGGATGFSGLISKAFLGFAIALGALEYWL